MGVNGQPEAQKLTFDAVIARLGLARAEVYRRVKDGALKGQKEGRDLVFLEADVAAFEEKRDGDQQKLLEAMDRWTAFFAVRSGTVETGETPPEKVEDRARKLAELMVREGVRLGASDLYLDPLRSGDRVLVRIGDRLDELARFEASLSGPLRTALRTLANIAADGAPTAATIDLTVAEQTHAVLLERAPTLLGEHMHLHYWGQIDGADLANLGFASDQGDALQAMLHGQSGVVLMARSAGPADDFHHAMLGQVLAANGLLVVSIESGLFPRCESLVQVAVNRAEDGAFVRALDTALRMAPDVLMVDALSDAAEARALFERLGAGGAVAAGMRAPDLRDALRRLLMWEIRPDALANWVLGGVERVMLRRLCPDCRKRRALDEEERAFWGGGDSVCEPVGCPRCGDGYLVRRPLFGVWQKDEALAEALRMLKADDALDVWAAQNHLGVGGGVRTGLLAGEISPEDARRLVARFGLAVSEGR